MDRSLPSTPYMAVVSEDEHQQPQFASHFAGEPSSSSAGLRSTGFSNSESHSAAGEEIFAAQQEQGQQSSHIPRIIVDQHAGHRVTCPGVF